MSEEVCPEEPVVNGSEKGKSQAKVEAVWGWWKWNCWLKEHWAEMEIGNVGFSSDCWGFELGFGMIATQGRSSVASRQVNRRGLSAMRCANAGYGCCTQEMAPLLLLQWVAGILASSHNKNKN